MAKLIHFEINHCYTAEISIYQKSHQITVRLSQTLIFVQNYCLLCIIFKSLHSSNKNSQLYQPITMSKHTAILLMMTLLLSVAFFANADSTIEIDEIDYEHEPKIGGYSQVDREDLLEFLEDPEFERAEQEARQAYLDQNGSDLGAVLDIHTQVVSGINYKIKFDTPSGNPVEVVVWVQPWLDSFQVLGIEQL